jgi:hypothetical protein
LITGSDTGAAAVDVDDRALHERGLVASKSQLFHYFPDGRSHLLLAVAC